MTMKRFLVTTLATFLFLFGATRLASAQTQTQTVDANINSALQLLIDVPFSPNPWMLSNGANSNTSLVLRAYANVPYALRANCDTDAAKGGNDVKLFEFLAGAYVAGGRFINATLQLRATGASPLKDITTNPAGDTIANAGGQSPTPSTGRTHTMELSQFVDFGDQSLSGGAMYHMVITYTIIAGAV